MRAFTLTLAITLAAGIGQSQTLVSGDLPSHIDSLIASLPSGQGADQYHTPSAQERSTWETIIGSLLQGAYPQADTLAASVGYRLLAFQNTSTPSQGLHYILEKTEASPNHWGVFVLNPSPRRPDLMIMCPHPLYDRNTGKQGAHVYVAVAPRILGISGTHRCNSTLLSPCSGTTTACSSTSERYRISDQAHTTDGMFQATTAALLAFDDSTIQVQLHGFARTATDPHIIMSNGTSQAPPPAQDYLLALRDNLLVVDPTLTFKVGHLDTDWTRLLGTTNVQGRLINGSPFPCTSSASSAGGRFLHLEQQYAGLRDTQQGWDKMASAIAMTFPEMSTAVQEEGPLAPRAFRVHPNYPNPFNPTTTIGVELPEARHMTITVMDLLGRTVAVLMDEDRSAGTTQVKWDAADHSSGPYFCLVTAGEWRAMLRLMLVK
jgi:hypothetical protein